MMRWSLVVLVVLNLLTLAWQWDAFARWGSGPQNAREPERVLNQIRPEALQIQMPLAAEASASASPVPAPTRP